MQAIADRTLGVEPVISQSLSSFAHLMQLHHLTPVLDFDLSWKFFLLYTDKRDGVEDWMDTRGWWCFAV